MSSFADTRLARERYSLKSDRNGFTTDLEWLVVAHNDSAMISRLSYLLDGKSSALLERSQEQWDLDGGDLADEITRSIRETSPSHLLLLGNSDCMTGEFVERMPDPSTVGNCEESNYNRLVAGAQSTHFQTQASKQHFADQIEHLMQLEEVQTAIGEGELQVHALFYLAQCGTFLLFDPAQGCFEPVIA